MAKPNLLKRWLLLDSTDADYAAAITSLTTLSTGHGETLTETASRWADINVVYCACTTAERNALSMSASLYLDEMNYSVLDNEHASDTGVPTVTDYGDSVTLYGKFLQPITTLPTTSVDRLVAYCKNTGSDTVYWVATTAAGTGDGSSYWNRDTIKNLTGASPSADATDYTIIVLCGRLYRYIAEGVNGGTAIQGSTFTHKTGSSGTRTTLISHATDTAEVIGGALIGNGTGSTGTYSVYSGTCYVARDTTGGGGGDPWHRGQYVLADSGGTGTLRVLELASSRADCAARADTYWYEYISGTPSSPPVIWDFYVNIGGDPTGKVYVPHTGLGYALGPSAVYSDWVGIKFYQIGWNFQPDANLSHWRALNVKWIYNNGYTIVPHGGTCNEGTGAMDTTTTMTDYQILGCEMGYVVAGHYSSSLSAVCPKDVVIQDTYIHHVGLDVDHADKKGGPNLDSAAPGDSHSIAAFGAITDVWVDNIRCDNVGPETIVWYISSDNHNVPGALAGTDAYTIGWPRAYSYTHFSDPTQEKTLASFFNILVEWVYITNPHPLTGEYSATQGMGLSNNGDSGDLYNYGGAQQNIVYRDCRVEGSAFSDGAIRHKISARMSTGATAHRTFEFDSITVRGAPVAVNIFGNVEDENGNTAEACVWVHDCDIHGTTMYVATINHSHDTRRKREFTGNIYRTDDGARWYRGAGEYADTLAEWQAFELGDDIHDPDGSEGLIPVGRRRIELEVGSSFLLLENSDFLVAEDSTPDTGDATCNISGTTNVGHTLTAVFNDDDPDGAATSITYQWLRDSTPIGGATSSTYLLDALDEGTMTSVQISYIDAQTFAETITSAEVGPIGPATVGGVGIGGAGVTLTITYGGVTLFSGIVHPTGGISG